MMNSLERPLVRWLARRREDLWSDIVGRGPGSFDSPAGGTGSTAAMLINVFRSLGQ